MKHTDIILLLSRFMDGETTVREERQLAQYFRSATAHDRPEQIAPEDWAAYCEMFRQFDQGMVSSEPAPQPLQAPTHAGRHVFGRYLTAAASAAAVIVIAGMTYYHGGDFVMDMRTSVSHYQTSRGDAPKKLPTQTATPPIDTLCKKGRPATKPSARPGSSECPKVPYTQTIPRRLMAQSASSQAEERQPDSITIALEEVEQLIQAMTIYQEIRVEELCNTDIQELY